jgi:hypothetical protein
LQLQYEEIKPYMAHNWDIAEEYGNHDCKDEDPETHILYDVNREPREQRPLANGPLQELYIANRLCVHRAIACHYSCSSTITGACL